VSGGGDRDPGSDEPWEWQTQSINQSIFVYLMYITTVKTQLRFTKKA